MAQVLVGALIAGLFGLLGGLYVKRLERQHWLRDRQLEAYSELLSLLSASVAEALNWDGGTDPASQEVRSAMKASFVPIIQSRGRVELLGPAAVSDLAVAAVRRVEEAWISAVVGDTTGDKTAWAAVEVFRAAAHKAISS